MKVAFRQAAPDIAKGYLLGINHPELRTNGLGDMGREAGNLIYDSELLNRAFTLKHAQLVCKEMWVQLPFTSPLHHLLAVQSKLIVLLNKMQIIMLSLHYPSEYLDLLFA